MITGNIPNPLKMYRYIYTPTDVVLEINGENYYYEEGAVTYIHFTHQFTTRHFPVIKMGLQTETGIIAKIYNYIDDVKLTFTIREDKVDEEEYVLDSTVFLKHTFSIIPAFEQPVYITADQIYDESKAVQQGGTEDTTGESETMRTYQQFEMYLIDLDIINTFDQEYSDHLENVSYAGALQKIFMARDIKPGESFATPPLQTGKLENITIPIGDMVENLIYLNTTYGLYDCNPIIYFDMQYYYCLSKIKPNIIYPQDGEFGSVTFILMDPENPTREVLGSNDDGVNKVHWINLQEDPIDYDVSIRDSNAKMSTLLYVNPLGEVKEENLDDNATRIRYIYSMNELTHQQVLNEMLHGPTIGVHMYNVKASFFKPFKDYKFITDTSYKGLNMDGHIFRILGFDMDIQRVGSEGYRTSETAWLYRPEHSTDTEE